MAEQSGFSTDKEPLDVYDEAGKIIGRAPRKEVHEKGLLHKMVNVIVLNRQKQFLVTERSSAKDLDVGKKDVGASGHVKHGQVLEEVALKEVEEETGVSVLLADLHALRERPFRLQVDYPDKMQDNIFLHVYLVVVDETETSIREKLKLRSISETNPEGEIRWQKEDEPFFVAFDEVRQGFSRRKDDFFGIVRAYLDEEGVFSEIEALFISSQELVRVDDAIVGKLAVPSSVAAVPGVLMLHGFASGRDEVGDMFKRLAETLLAHGIASLRIDFRGCGASNGKLAETTIDGQLRDAEKAYQYMVELKSVDTARLGILGFSLGGGIAMLSSARHPDGYKSMVVWSSDGDFETDFLTFLGRECFDRADRDGSVEVDLEWRIVKLNASFFQSLKTYNILSALNKHEGAFFAIVGKDDKDLVGYVDLFMEEARGEPKDFHVVEDADHIFYALDEGKTKTGEVIHKTVEWFVHTL